MAWSGSQAHASRRFHPSHVPVPGACAAPEPGIEYGFVILFFTLPYVTLRCYRNLEAPTPG